MLPGYKKDSEEQKIKIIEEEVIKSIDPSWNKDETIRYVYLYIGKYISKNVSFFYSLGRKLDNKNYDYKRIKSTYDSKQIRNLSVICKSAAVILQRIYKKLGIKSELIETTQFNPFTDEETKETLEVHHWFLAATGENDRTYFLTIVPDLFNIQFNMKTEHYGNNITYVRENKKGEQEVQYKGPEIKHTVLSDEELARIDEKIGYIIPYTTTDEYGKQRRYDGYDNIFIENLRTYLRKNNYIIELGYDTKFFKDILKYKVNGMLIEDYLNTHEFDMNEIDKWIEFIKEKAAFYGHNPNEDKDVNGKINSLRNSLINKDVKKYRVLISQLGTNFVDDKYKIERHGYCSQEYLEKKFEYLFPKFFGLNETSNYDNKSISLLTRFTGLSEKLDFIDMFIENMFPELREAKASEGIKINPKYSLYRNRIQRYVIYSTRRKQFDIIFSIDNSNTYYYLDPVKGTFKKLNNLLNLISDEFIVVSDELRNRMQEVENIEEPLIKTLDEPLEMTL